MGELLLRKAIAIRDRLARIRASLPAVPEDVTRDERLEAFVSFHIFLLIQDSVDLAAHLVTARGLAVPGSQRELYQALADAKLISPATAAAMAQMSSLRNRIAHAYGDLDPVRLVREAPTGLAHVEQFLAEVAALLGDAG